MSHEVIDFDKHLPHFTIVAADGVHVISLKTMTKVSRGELPLECLGDDVLRAILGDFLIMSQ